jgi:membrane protein required for colicin V production
MGQFGFLLMDTGIVAVMLISALLAASRGFVKEILAVGAWIAAALTALFLFPLMKNFTRDLVSREILADGITIGMIFVLTLVFVSLISQPISKRVRESNMGSADRALGFGFGLVRGAFIITIGYLLLTWVAPVNDQPDWLRDAKLLPLVEQAGQWLLELVPTTFRNENFMTAASVWSWTMNGEIG